MSRRVDHAHPTLRVRLQARIIRLAMLLSLVAAAVPGQAMAASNGSTTESLTKSATIALVVPASVTYANVQTGDATATVSITGITTDNPTGLKITLSVNPTGGSAISRSTRSNSAWTASAGLTGSGAIAEGGWVANNGSAIIVQSSGAVTNGTASSTLHVNTSGYAPGVFTGQLDFLATANP